MPLHACLVSSNCSCSSIMKGTKRITRSTMHTGLPGISLPRLGQHHHGSGDQPLLQLAVTEEVLQQLGACAVQGHAQNRCHLVVQNRVEGELQEQLQGSP